MRLAGKASLLGCCLLLGAGCTASDPGGAGAGDAGSGSGGSTAPGTGGASGATGGATGSGGGTGGSAALDAGDAGDAGDAIDAIDAGDAGGKPIDAPTPDGRDAQSGDAPEVTSFDAPKIDGGIAYNPCPPKGMPCVILPIGDSITWGAVNPASGGYRSLLFHLAHASQQAITFVGAQADGPAMVDGVPFPRNHEGHPGYNIDNTQGRAGIHSLFPMVITTYKPDIILLMIGTNDVDTGVDNIPGRLGALMDTILDADPTLLLVVAQIVPQGSAAKNVQVKAFNDAIPGLVKARADAGKHVVTVDMFSPFTANPNFSSALLADGLHPNAAGYTIMANTWYAAIGPLLR